MSLIGDLLGFGGTIYSAKSIADANKEAANTTAQAQRDVNKNTLDFISQGTVDPYGNVMNRRDPETGALTTTLTPGFKDLSNQLITNQQGAAKARGALAPVASRGVADFSGFTASGGRPDFSMADARGIVNADDLRLQKALVEPALDNAAITDKRNLGRTSNAGNITAKTMKELLPQIKLGGETRALELKDKMDQQFIKKSLGITDDALRMIGGGPQANIPGATTAGELSALANASKVAVPTAPPDYGTAALASGVANLGNIINANEQRDKTDALIQQLLAQRLKANERLPVSED